VGVLFWCGSVALGIGLITIALRRYSLHLVR
jgi:hypothetical protein